MTVLWDCNGGRVILNLCTMSSITPENSNEGESILPEVEELSEFHPDHLSNLVDIQEELEKLEASQNATEELMSMPTVDDVNIVDHEVTIAADQENEDILILPEINHDPKILKESENTIGEKEVCSSENVNISNSEELDPSKNTLNVIGDVLDNKNQDPLDTSGLVIDQASLITPQLNSLRPLPVTEIMKGKKPVIGMTQTKSNVFTKVVFTPNNQSIYGDTIKIVGPNKSGVLTNSTKTITVSQAREMGIFSSGKLQQILPNQSKGIIKKNVVINPNKTLTMMKSSPTKILPLPPGGTLHSLVPSPSGVNTLSMSASSHKIFIRQPVTSVKSGTFSGTILNTNSAGNHGPILQLPVSQDNSNQIHQIQLPGKQVQYVRLVTSSVPGSVAGNSSGELINKTEPLLMTKDIQQPVPVALTTNISASSQIKMVPIAPAQPVTSCVSQNTSSFERVLVSPGVNQLTARTDTKPPTSNIVMVPAEYVKQYKPLPINKSPPSPPKLVVPPPPTPPPPPPPPLLTKAKEVISKEIIMTPTTQRSKMPTEPPNGIRPRKPCNCTKSQCLKLYCDCFANGEFCFQCNCNCCFNNLDHEEERQRAIKSCLERNPNAFRPKIGKGYIGDERRHNKGCNCKRSGCLKNYCECYEAKIPCSNNCKCVGCRNVEETKDRSSEGSKINHQIALKNKLSSEIEESAFKPNSYLNNQGVRQPFSLMTHEVVEATCQCLLAQVEEVNHPTEHVERIILEEFGRCLVEIINCATRTTVNNPT